MSETQSSTMIHVWGSKTLAAATSVWEYIRPTLSARVGSSQIYDAAKQSVHLLSLPFHSVESYQPGCFSCDYPVMLTASAVLYFG